VHYFRMRRHTTIEVIGEMAIFRYWCGAPRFLYSGFLNTGRFS